MNLHGAELSRRPTRLSRVHRLSSVELESVSMMVRERYFVPHWEALDATGQPVPPPKAHGGRIPLKPADYLQLFIVDEGAPERGAFVSDILRFRPVPTRLLCEIARLMVRAKQREIALARQEAVARERERWSHSEVPLDRDGEARLRRKLKEIEKKFPKPNYQQEFKWILASWGVYFGTPSRTSLHRLSAGTDRRKLYAHILRIHLWKRRAFRFLTP